MKRFFAALLAALMVFSLVTIPAVAEGEVVFEVPTVNAQPFVRFALRGERLTGV